jgi:small subunit ribosomal protein S21
LLAANAVHIKTIQTFLSENPVSFCFFILFACKERLAARCPAGRLFGFAGIGGPPRPTGGQMARALRPKLTRLVGKSGARGLSLLSGQTRLFLLSPPQRSGAPQAHEILFPSGSRVPASKVRDKAPSQQDTGVQVLVRDNNVDQALKALKKKMQREGIFREMKLRGHYEKPSEKRAREQAEAVRRARKLARKKMQREGLLPMKAKPAAR